VNTSRFAGQTYSSKVELGRPGFAFLRLIGSPVGQGPQAEPGAPVQHIEPIVIPVHDFTIRVSASAIGNLKAVGEGVAQVDAKPVPLKISIEHY
jgi:hypothetical protein